MPAEICLSIDSHVGWCCGPNACRVSIYREFISSFFLPFAICIFDQRSGWQDVRIVMVELPN